MICTHCKIEIGEVVDPWGGKHGFMHRLSEGPDAYTYCKCRCKDCFDLGPHPVKVAQDYPCCDGEEAEPVTVLHLVTEPETCDGERAI